MYANPTCENPAPMKVDDLSTPALLVDRKIVENNCQAMLQTSKKAGNIKLRAQTKTHKTVEGAVLQTGGTKRSLVCSTQAECELYAESGFDDILYGQVLLECHMQRNTLLQEKLEEYHVMIGNMEGAKVLESWKPPTSKPW